MTSDELFYSCLKHPSPENEAKLFAFKDLGLISRYSKKFLIQDFTLFENSLLSCQKETFFGYYVVEFLKRFPALDKEKFYDVLKPRHGSCYFLELARTFPDFRIAYLENLIIEKFMDEGDDVNLVYFARDIAGANKAYIKELIKKAKLCDYHRAKWAITRWNQVFPHDSV